MATKKTVAKKSTPVTKSTTAKTTAKKKTAVKKKAAAATKTTPKKTASPSRINKAVITPDQRHLLICETAYFMSIDQGAPGEGDSVENWLQAESIIDKKYSVVDQ